MMLIRPAKAMCTVSIPSILSIEAQCMGQYAHKVHAHAARQAETCNSV